MQRTYLAYNQLRCQPAGFFVAHAIDVNQWAVEDADGNPLSVREVLMPEHSETGAKTVRKKTG